MQQKIIRMNLLLLLSLSLFACAKNQLKLDNASSAQAASTEPANAGDKKRTKRPSITDLNEKVNVIRGVVTPRQFSNMFSSDGKRRGNLTDEQVKKLDELDASLLVFYHPKVLALLTAEQVEGIRRGNHVLYTAEQQAQIEKLKPELMAELETSSSLEAGDMVPDFELKDNYGNTRNLSDFRGKYLVIDFWGTWCGPCIEAMPKIKKAYQQVDKNKVEFIGICSNCTDFKGFVKREGLNWVQLEDTVNNDAVDTYGIQAFPTMLLIDPQGRLLHQGTDLSSDILGNLQKYMK